MPEREPITVEIDEVLPANNGEDFKSAHPTRSAGSAGSSKKRDEASGAQPFPDLASSLGWKARITLLLTQWLLILRTKSWGKWVLAPLVILLILLAIPLAMIGMFALIIVSFIKALTGK